MLGAIDHASTVTFFAAKGTKKPKNTAEIHQRIWNTKALPENPSVPQENHQVSWQAKFLNQQGVQQQGVQERSVTSVLARWFRQNSHGPGTKSGVSQTQQGRL